MSTSSSRLCPCTSTLPYAACCGPLHRLEREAEDAPALVRSRYSAFALGEIEYLYRTLHSEHADKAQHARDRVLAALRAASGALKYMGLTFLDQRTPVAGDARGFAQVLYLARVFRKGTDVSFLELADFEREPSELASGGAFRYLAGKVRDASAGTSSSRVGLTIGAFEEELAGSADAKPLEK